MGGGTKMGVGPSPGDEGASSSSSSSDSLPGFDGGGGDDDLSLGSGSSSAVRRLVRSLRNELERVHRRVERQEAKQTKAEGKIQELKGKVKTLRREVKALQNADLRREQMGFTAGLVADAAGGRLGTSGTQQPLGQEEMARLAQEMMSRLSLSQYVTLQELNDRGFVDQNFLNSHVPSAPTIQPVPRLADRLKAVESDVVDPDGRLNQLVLRLDDLADTKISDSVMVANVVFRDIPSVEAFLSHHTDPEVFRFCADMKVQLMDLQDRYTTVKDALSLKADVNKASYTTEGAAVTAISFDFSHPECLIRTSKKEKAAEKEGFIFAPELATPKIFKGTLTTGTLARFKKLLQTNMMQRQRELDLVFPVDHPRTAQTHSVFSEILQKGNYQAVAFLESLLPFHDTLVEAGIESKTGWNDQILTYVKAVGDRVQTTRSILREGTPASMLMGMFRATKMLDRYVELDFVSHPDVAMALVLAALSREGKSAGEALSKAKAAEKTVGEYDKRLAALENDNSKLKSKNPQLFKG